MNNRPGDVVLFITPQEIKIINKNNLNDYHSGIIPPEVPGVAKQYRTTD
jgi:hypothetical protein